MQKDLNVNSMQLLNYQVCIVCYVPQIHFLHFIYFEIGTLLKQAVNYALLFGVVVSQLIYS